MPTRECDKGIAVRDSAVKGRHATGGGAVFWVGWSVYNRVLRKKLIGLFCGDFEGEADPVYGSR